MSFNFSRRLSADAYADGILAGDRIILSKAITLAESNLPTDQQITQAVLDQILHKTGNSMRIGLTGIPGVGKSTFIESFGNFIIQKDRKLAVLAVDPTSSITGGSILGDKTRMETLSRNSAAFIRPSPSKTVLGGVTDSTRESILFCEAAGFDTIIVETVGVGQSEVLVKNMTDLFMLLLLPGAGDELQGIKKGIMEMGELFVITKVDGDNIDKAKRTKAELKSALHSAEEPASGFFPKIISTSAIQNTGFDEVWQEIEGFFDHINKTGWKESVRKNQQKIWFKDLIIKNLLLKFNQEKEIKSEIDKALQQVETSNDNVSKTAFELINKIKIVLPRS